MTINSNLELSVQMQLFSDPHMTNKSKLLKAEILLNFIPRKLNPKMSNLNKSNMFASHMFCVEIELLIKIWFLWKKLLYEFAMLIVYEISTENYYAKNNVVYTIHVAWVDPERGLITWHQSTKMILLLLKQSLHTQCLPSHSSLSKTALERSNIWHT